MAGTNPAMTVKSKIFRMWKASRIQPLEYQRGVGAAKPERVRQHGAELGVVDALAHDRHVGECRIKLGDVRAFADKSVVHHQERVDRLLNAGGAERMAGQRLG